MTELRTMQSEFFSYHLDDTQSDPIFWTIACSIEELSFHVSGHFKADACTSLYLSFCEYVASREFRK
jgi:hypothetical protein